MTIERRDFLLSPLPLGKMFWATMIVVVLAGAGCMAPAALAPLALQAGEMASAGALNAAGYAVEGKPGGDGSVDPGEQEERCDELQLEVPGTIEFHVVDDNATAWRQLQLGGSTDAPQWQAVVGEQSDAAGWRPL